MKSANIILVVSAPEDGQKMVDSGIVEFYANPDFSPFTYGSFPILKSQHVEGKLIILAKKSEIGVVYAPCFEYKGLLDVLNYDNEVRDKGEFLFLVEFRPSIKDISGEFHILMDERNMYILNCAMYHVLYAYHDSFKGKTPSYRQMLKA